MATREETAMISINLRKHRSGSGADAQPAADFSDVYRRFLKPVYAFIAYRVENRSAAEDITSRIFEKAWRGFSGYNPARAEISTWIFAIARNCLTDHFRDTARKPAEVELPADLRSGAATDPEPLLEALELRNEVRKALNSLGPQELEIMGLRFGATISNREIAKIMNISETNVSTILFRSLRKLKTQLEGGINHD